MRSTNPARSSPRRVLRRAGNVPRAEDGLRVGPLLAAGDAGIARSAGAARGGGGTRRQNQNGGGGGLRFMMDKLSHPLNTCPVSRRFYFTPFRTEHISSAIS